MSVQLEAYNDDTILIADVDGDASLTSADALDLLRYSVSLSENERIGQPI